MTRARQGGATGLFILAILLLIIAGIFAGYILQRVAAGGNERADTQRRLARAVATLVQFAAANRRLPCPADPTTAMGAANDGVEVQLSAARCTFDEGTLPWKTLGMKSEDGFDTWGRKISYRVYTGNAGSLTQPGGVSMVECDTVEPTAGDATPVAASLGGLCVSSADPYARSTTPAKFLDNKGLSLTDFGVAHNDTAFIVISHGATGLGGYTASGTRLDMPAGDERNNTKDTGPFTIRNFSDPDTGVSNAQHFDDLLAYLTLPDLVKAAGLEARDWPETSSTTAKFDSATVGAAVGRTVTAGEDLGTATVNVPGVAATGFSGGTATDITFDVSSGNTTTGLGIAGNASNMMSNVGDEYIKLQFASPAANFAVTFNDFGIFPTKHSSPKFTERVQLTFTLGGTTVGSPVVKSGCDTDGDLASFTIAPSGAFDGVEIRPLDAPQSPSGTAGNSSFLVSEVNACAATASTCKTSLQNGGNTCP